MLHDAIIVGGSFAGLSAALQLARARRNVLVIDAGLPRNRFASESHGVLGHDGKPGSQVLAEARQQLLAYPTVQIFNGRVSRVQPARRALSSKPKTACAGSPAAACCWPPASPTCCPKSRPGGALGQDGGALPVLPRL
jgi:anaerobic glycerol-3-phosphate dehydrogenase